MAFNSLMHDRNIYKERPDFARIALDYPEFRKYALSDAKGKVRVDFNNPDALRILTKILLKKDFNLSVEIPKGFLIPTIPQRLNYILWIEDLLAALPTTNEIPHGIDIGCGPCAIFSILGAKKNGWKFASTETSDESLQWALANIKNNDLNSLIKVIKVSPEYTLSEVLSSNEDVYDFCLCNPPFFENVEEIRKKNAKVKETLAMIAKQEEIIAEGGEVAFVKKIIDESLKFRDRVRLYTSMFGKKKSFAEIIKILQNVKDITLTKSQFCQGNTIRWSVAWTFSKSVCFEKVEKPKPKKPQKAKAPLVYCIPKSIEGVHYNVQELSKTIWNILKDLEILIKVSRFHEHYTESQITTDRNTWSHQRRKRRELKRNINSAGHNIQVSVEKTAHLTHSSGSLGCKMEDVTSPLSEDKTISSSSIQSSNESIPIKSEKIDDFLTLTNDSIMDLTEPKNEPKKRKSNSNLCDSSNESKRVKSEKSGDYLTSTTESVMDLTEPKNELKKSKPSSDNLDLSNESKPVKSEKSDVYLTSTNKSMIDLADSKNESKNCKLSGDDTDSSKRSLDLNLIDEHSLKISIDNPNFSMNDSQSCKGERAAESSEYNMKSSTLTFSSTKRSHPSVFLKPKDFAACEDDKRNLENSIPSQKNRGNTCNKEFEGSNLEETSLNSSIVSLNSFPEESQQDIDLNSLPSDEVIVENSNRSEACNDCKPLIQDKCKNKCKQGMKRKVDLIPPEKQNTKVFEPKSLLFCILKIRKAKDNVLMEMNCPPEANRESMHQIFQYLKNKFH